MLRIDIISVVPELLESPLSYSIPARAVKKGLAEIHIHDLRKYGLGSRQTVDPVPPVPELLISQLKGLYIL